MQRPLRSRPGVCLTLPVIATLLAVLAGAPSVEACGGRTATIAADPAALGGTPGRTADGTPYRERADGGVTVGAAEVQISSALAEAIAARYLADRYGRFSHLEFEAFTLEHGALVYMYHAEVPGLAASYHVGPLRFVTPEAHVHVDAVTGAVYGCGCGGGPGIVDLPFEPGRYPKALSGQRLPYRQFDAHFQAGEGMPPRVDGRIEPDEWKDAARAVLEVGSRAGRATEYG